MRPALVLPAVLAAAFVGITALSAANALTVPEKTETCTIGADAQKLKGTARKSFMTKCLADEDAPAARSVKSSKKK